MNQAAPMDDALDTAGLEPWGGIECTVNRDFARALVTQCRAVVCALQAIREVTPGARLIHTEEMGRICSTPAMAELTRFGNHRRCLSLDLVCGRVGREHPLREYLLRSSVTERELAFFEENACPPDVVGVSDVRAHSPRPRALARLVSDLAHGRTPEDEPLIAQPGWWRRAERLFQLLTSGRAAPATEGGSRVDMQDRSFRPLLIVGAHGTLGGAFVRLCDARGIGYHLSAREELDFTRPLRAEQLLLETNAWAVVNAAGYVRVDDAEHEAELVEQVNATGPAELAAACAQQGLPLVTFSSDLVFDGQATSPYTESARVGPLNVYGRSKAAMEARVLARNPAALVIRTSSFFGPWDDANFVTRSLEGLRAGHVITPLKDVVVSPTYVPDLVNAALDLLIDRARGVWHLANVGAVTWYELARRAAELAGLPTHQIHGRSASELGLAAPRPRYSALESERGCIMPSLDDALTRYLASARGRDAHSIVDSSQPASRASCREKRSSSWVSA